jgi:ribokinase
VKPIVILGIFVADCAFRASRLPVVGETLLGQGFALGPGGKGSNQAVAAALAAAGRPVRFISRIGRDAFGEIALGIWSDAGVDAALVRRDDTRPTGAAFIFVSTESGDNAIIVEPGAGGAITAADVDAAQAEIAAAAVFVTQLEQPVATARRGLEFARRHGVPTILNPAPAMALDAAIYPLCDYLTPNETEAASLTGLPVTTLDEARAAAEVLAARGVGTVVLTLGEKGALVHGQGQSVLVPSFPVARVVDTTGAGDAFTGGFAVALAEGMAPVAAARFGCATAALSVQRPGTAGAMPKRPEIEALLRAHG